MSEQTISQALRQVKKLKGRLAEATSRAAGAVSHVEGQTPAFTFNQSLEQANKLRADLISLVSQIRVTNALTTIEHNGKKLTLTEAVAKLEDLKGEIAWFKGLPVKAQDHTNETDWSYESGQRVQVTVRWTCHFPEAKRAAEVERLQDIFDRLNDAVERANHATVLRPVA
jgi:hypothetical protein